MNLFKKAALLTDIHLGLKNNAVSHNEDCLNFIDWFVKTAKSQGCETCIFLGDWHNHRASISVQTLQYSLRALEKLNDAFDNVFFITGNHDQFYRANRDAHSVEWARHLPNVTIVNDIIDTGDVVLAPWLMPDEHEKLSKMSAKYLFGHFELPHFYMNSLVEMPDHGGISLDHVSSYEEVFSGHFHKRQARKNCWYIGNCFPHNFSDVNDDARGMGVLEWGKPIKFFSWPDQPVFRSYALSQVLDDQTLLLPNSHTKVLLDIDITYEEATFIKEQLIPQYSLREMILVPQKKFDSSKGESYEENRGEPVDHIIHTQIASVQSDFYDPKLLIEIYNKL